MFEELNEESFLIFAARFYDNPSALTVDEFYEDLNRFKSIKRLLNKYKRNNENLQERLILNHIITLQNVFSIKPLNKMLFYKIDEDNWPQLKTFLIFLNYIKPDFRSEIPIDPYIANILRKI